MLNLFYQQKSPEVRWKVNENINSTIVSTKRLQQHTPQPHDSLVEKKKTKRAKRHTTK